MFRVVKLQLATDLVRPQHVVSVRHVILVVGLASPDAVYAVAQKETQQVSARTKRGQARQHEVSSEAFHSAHSEMACAYSHQNQNSQIILIITNGKTSTSGGAQTD